MTDASDRISELKIDRAAKSDGNPSRRGLSIGIAALVVAVAVAAWYLRTVGETVAVTADTARKPPSVAAASSVLDASGYVVARRQATVSSEVTGKVIDVMIEEGMRVEKDQVVALLDPSTEQARLDLIEAQSESARAQLAETAAQLRNARLDRDRLRDLAGRNLASAASLDAAVARHDELEARLETGRENVKVAERNVALAEDALANMTIRAPFAGMVVSKNAQPGEMISPVSAGGGFTRTGICTIVDMASLEIEVDVNEAYIQRVRPKQSVSATLDAYPDWQIPAEVIAIIPTADRQKATVRVRIGFLERDDRILRDMGAKVAFLGAQPPSMSAVQVEGVTVARGALRSDADGDFVWRISDSRLERRRVVISGSTERERVLLADGLRSGDLVVLTADGPLEAGQEVALD